MYCLHRNEFTSMFLTASPKNQAANYSFLITSATIAHFMSLSYLLNVYPYFLILSKLNLNNNFSFKEKLNFFY